MSSTPTAGLDGDRPAEPAAEDKDRPEPQSTAGSEEDDAEPANANGIAVEGPERLSVRVGRQIARRQPDQPKGKDDPAIGAILALAEPQTSATEERYAGQQEDCHRDGNQFGVREEGGEPAPAENSEPRDRRRGPRYGDEGERGCLIKADSAPPERAAGPPHKRRTFAVRSLAWVDFILADFDGSRDVSLASFVVVFGHYSRQFPVRPI